MPPDLRLTLPTLQVFRALLEPPEGPHHGYDLMQRAHLKSGSLYPILARLEQHGLVTSTWENIDPKAAGRPARREYRLTPTGVIQARAALERAESVLKPLGDVRHA